MSISDDNITDFQANVATHVNDLYETLSREGCLPFIVTKRQMYECIMQFKGDAAPGYDNIVGEHLKYGLCDELLSHMCSAFADITKYNIVPHNFTVGVIIPILKKSTLDPSVPDRYTPLTMSSIFSKLYECITFPRFNCANTQFGFVKKKEAVNRMQW